MGCHSGWLRIGPLSGKMTGILSQNSLAFNAMGAGCAQISTSKMVPTDSAALCFYQVVQPCPDVHSPGFRGNVDSDVLLDLKDNISRR